MLEHSAMLYSASSPPPPMLADEDMQFPDFYTRLGPCELQDPLWVKMSAVAAGATKKRKKSDTKPQAQINKCHNEKRRREQENIYIEELAELITTHIGEMSSLSVKPDKCHILQETVNQIRNIKARDEAGGGGGGPEGAVQQGEVSSSRPTILANEVIAPLLLDALDGFLFVVNADAKVEFVTDNVDAYIRFSRDEVLGKSVYNIIHHGDHARFSTTLLPSIAAWGAGGGSGGDSSGNSAGNTAATNGTSGASRSRSFYCRLLVKPLDELDEAAAEDKPPRGSKYEQMHISSTPVPYSGGGGVGGGDSEEGGGEAGPCVMCLARRVPQCEKAAGTSIEQFTTKLDTAGRVVGVDTSGVSGAWAASLAAELAGRALPELCAPPDQPRLAGHLKETLSSGQAASDIYRLRLAAPDRFLRVQTKSKLFRNSPPDHDFIMATHSIIGEHEPGGAGLELDAGGPMMPSVLNGARNGVGGGGRFGSDGGSSTTSLTPNSSASYNPFQLGSADLSDFDFFPSSTWGELGAGSGTGWGDTPRPDSCQSVTPVSTPTPRPPSAPAYSPAQPAQPSPSPAAAPNAPFPGAYPFSPLADASFEPPAKDAKELVMEEAATAPSAAPASMADSGRLRDLLTKPPASSSDAAAEAEARNKHHILMGLLNQEDEDDGQRTSPRGLVGGRLGNAPAAPQGPTAADRPKHANNMLLRLLNEKSDDDDLEQRAGLKKQSELLHQLLKEQDEERKPTEQQTQDDSLLRSLGFTSSPSPPPGTEPGPGRARKRPSDERDELMAKRSNDATSAVSSSGPSAGNSKLYEKNKMLASLLANKPSSTPIPPIPASVISAMPQEKLPRVTKNFGGQQPTAASPAGGEAGRRMARGGSGPAAAARPATSYLNQMLAPGGAPNRTSYAQLDAAAYPGVPTSCDNAWDIHSSCDPLLSDILDQVIDIVPDAEISDSSAIMNLLDAIESPQNNNNNFQQAMNEKMAINAIQKSLMQCESAVKSSSPNISLPGTPPAYSTALTSTAGAFGPPPIYQRPGPGGFQLQGRAGPPMRAPGGPQYAMAAGQQQQLLLQQRKLLQQQQQEHKRRLLHQQRQQHLVIPSNATAAELNAGLQNIDSLMNNTVAPNVTLQRSSSVPDSQLSPDYMSGQGQGRHAPQQQQQQQQQQQPYSPLGQQQAGYPQTSVNNFQQGGARLSPHPPFQQQLSPRQGYPPAQSAPPATWAQTQVANRLSLQQQQNPMLNAQLTGNYAGNNRGFPVQRQQQAPQQQRAIGSPGAANTRQSPFPADAFPPPASPTSGFASQNQFQQQMRLQRTISAPPTATTQLPGGLGSPRQYAGSLHQPPYPGPTPPHPAPNHHHQHQHQHPMMYQQDSQYCYDQTTLQLAFNGADRGRGPPPHLQAGGAGGGNATSEYVRQELRAVVGARTGQGTPGVRQSTQQVSAAEFEALGLSFEMPTSGASDSPKLWGAMGSDMGSMSPQPPPTLSSSSRTTTEEMARPGDQKSSLLQKLLSE